MNRFKTLFCALLLFFLINPFLEDYVGVQLLADIFISLIFFSAVYVASHDRRQITIALVLAIPAVLARWTTYFLESRTIDIGGEVFGLAFFAYITAIILAWLFRQRRVTVEIILAGICVYFILGIMWSTAYYVMEIALPGSFDFPVHLQPAESTFTYYSFVTLTTLGYGDITPVTALARNLSVLEAVIGQLYIAVLIAGLVGMYIADSKKDSEPQEKRSKKTL